MAVRKPKVDAKWRNRIVEYGEITASELEANPRNPRVHGDQQKAAMTSVLDDVGWVAPVIVNRTTGLVVDGHMRVGLAQDGPIPVAWVELSEAEENEMLALMDPIGSMAEINSDLLNELVDQGTLSDSLSAVIADLLPEADDEPAEKPKSVDLKPLKRAHVLVSVDLDEWDRVSEILDQLDGIDGVTVRSTVN